MNNKTPLNVFIDIFQLNMSHFQNEFLQPLVLME